MMRLKRQQELQGTVAGLNRVSLELTGQHLLVQH